MMRWLLGLCLCVLTIPALSAEKVVNVYIWADYLPDTVIEKFEQATGIKVNISEYDSNETMYAKIKSQPRVSYDVIVPSDYFVDRMRKQGMLQALDKTKLPHFKNFNPGLLDRPFDPHNQFSVPYLWGSAGIVVNNKYLDPRKVTRWADFWQPQYRNQLIMLDDMRMVFAIALKKLGYSINDTNPEHIKQAYLELISLMPNIKLFNSNAADSIFVDEDGMIGFNFSGDTFRDSKENPHLEYIYPAEGFPVWIDSLAIPKGAPHLENAYQFINFISQPEIAKEIAAEQNYPSPNLDAMKLLPPEFRNNPTLNPPASILKRGESQIDLGPVTDIYAKYWQQLKING